MRTWLALLVAAVVLIALWSLRGTLVSRDGAAHVRSATNASRMTSSALDEADGVDPARIPLPQGGGIEPGEVVAASMVDPDTLRVRSSIGLELVCAEFEMTPGYWLEVALVDGRCPRSQVLTAMSVRAPGHVAVALSATAAEIVLEPDALLTVHATGLRDCVRVLEPNEFSARRRADGTPILSDGPRRAVAWGWVSEDEWVAAVTPVFLANAWKDEAQFLVRWRDERTAWITFRARPGARERWDFPCEERVPGEPLRLRVKRPHDLEAGPLSVQFSRPKDGRSTGWHTKFSWGQVNGWADDQFRVTESVDPGSDEVTLPFAPVARLLVFARDETSGAYGRTSFVHDGTPRELVLRPPFELRGRLVADATSAPLTRADLSTVVSESEGGKPTWGWQLFAHDTQLDDRGGFKVRGPVTPVMQESVPLEVPAWLVLTVVAPGFEPCDRAFETNHADVLDCGELRLTERAPDLVLEPGHGVDPAQVKWHTVQTGNDGGSLWNVRSAALQPDGALAIYLRRSEKDPHLVVTVDRESRAWPTPSPACCLVYTPDQVGPRAFERTATGTYSAVVLREREIELDFRQVAEPVSFRAGWIWRGLVSRGDYIPAARMGEVVRLMVSAPMDEVTLFWSTTFEPPKDPGDRGGTMPIDSITAPIVVR